MVAAKVLCVIFIVFVALAQCEKQDDENLDEMIRNAICSDEPSIFCSDEGIEEYCGKEEECNEYRKKIAEEMATAP